MKKLKKKTRNFFLSNLSFFEYGVFQINKKKFLKSSKELKIEILKKNFNNSFWKNISTQRGFCEIFD